MVAGSTFALTFPVMQAVSRAVSLSPLPEIEAFCSPSDSVQRPLFPVSTPDRARFPRIPQPGGLLFAPISVGPALSIFWRTQKFLFPLPALPFLFFLLTPQMLQVPPVVTGREVFSFPFGFFSFSRCFQWENLPPSFL